MNIRGLYLMGDVTYFGCRVETIFVLPYSILSTFVLILLHRELLISCNVRISTLYCVYDILFSWFTYCVIGISLRFRNSGVSTKLFNMHS
jgi:hypothetical protein